MADTLIHNARIRTMDPTAPEATWVLLQSGKVAALGHGIPPDAPNRIDAGGRLVLPGFQDAHIHLLSGGINIATAASLYDVTNEAELISTLRAHAVAQPQMPIVLGSGWQAGVFGDENLTAKVIDHAVSDRPVLIYDSSFHNACLNSRAHGHGGPAGHGRPAERPYRPRRCRTCDGHAA
jgi:predicted amidohydrolase YtcJ